MDLYNEGRVNFITICICWISLFILSISLYLNRNLYDCIQLLKAGSIMFLIPSAMYIYNKHSRYIKYAIVYNELILVYITLYIQNGIFDNIFYVILSIIITAVYFDHRFTMVTTFICVVSSSIFYFFFKDIFFPTYSVDNYVSLQLALGLSGLVISIQTYLSNKLVLSQQVLYDKAIRDKLTHLYNRNYFDEIFNVLVDKSKRYKRRLAVIIIDIDDFKTINDTYGHAKGDSVLKLVSNNIQNVCKKQYIPARIGGEEFIILLNDLNKESVMKLAEKLRMDIMESSIDGVNVTISLGITSLEDTDSTDTLFARADKALYQAKNQGKNCVVEI